MGSGAIKWHVHCSVCGAFIEKERTKRFRSGVQKMSQYIGDICKG